MNIMQEQDIQIRGFPVRLSLDLCLMFSANPEDYTNRGAIITPLPAAFFGDGNLDPGEGCDDGNNTDGDGCSATCTIEVPTLPEAALLGLFLLVVGTGAWLLGRRRRQQYA